jgi:hypothetical protein
VKAALAEILIVQLHGHVLSGDQPRRLTRMIVFDEAHRVKDSKRLEQLAREGRAFGVGIVLPDDIPETMAGNLASQLFLMNNQATHRRLIVTQLLGTTTTSEAKGLLDKLGQLKPLQGLFTNTHNNGVFPRRTHRRQPETPNVCVRDANGHRVSRGRFRVVGCGAFRLDFDGGLGGEAEETALFIPVMR